LHCSCSVTGWSLSSVSSSSMLTFSMDSFFIPVSSPQVLFCTSALENKQWLGLLSPCRTPFLAP
jgi:hypothetical protein